MRDVDTRVLTASPGLAAHHGHTDIQTEGLTELPPSMPGVHARLTLIHTGPRGAVKSVTTLLTDDQRRQLIEQLGGYPDPPETHLVQPEDFDSLRAFENEDQRDEFAALHLSPVTTGTAEVLDRQAASEVIEHERAYRAKDIGEVRCPCGEPGHTLETHPTRQDTAWHPILGEYVMDDPIAEHRDGEHGNWDTGENRSRHQCETCPACDAECGGKC